MSFGLLENPSCGNIWDGNAVLNIISALWARDIAVLLLYPARFTFSKSAGSASCTCSAKKDMNTKVSEKSQTGTFIVLSCHLNSKTLLCHRPAKAETTSTLRL